MRTIIRYFLFCISLLTFCRCSENEPPKNIVEKKPITWTEEQKRKYFADSISHRMYNGRYGAGDSINDFDIFTRVFYADLKAKNKNDVFLYAFEEPFIDTTQIQNDVSWFRISVVPSFSKPYCVILEKKGDKSYLTSKMTDASSSYFSGTLDFAFTKVFSDSLYDAVSKQLNNLNFWKLSVDTLCQFGIDGQTWCFEAIENGKYNVIYRWGPDHCGDSITKSLGQLGIELRKTSRVFDIYSELNGIKK